LTRLVLLTVLLGLLFYGGQWLWRKLAPRLAEKKRHIALAVGVLAVLLLALSGRLVLLFAGLGAAAAYLLRRLPQLMRWAPLLQDLWRQWRVQRGAAVETARLRLHPGRDEGWVLSGAHAGRALRELSLDQLLALWREWRLDDAASAALLEGYLDRQFGSEWRRVAEGRQGRGRAAGGKMSREEAREVLGLQPSASDKDIVAAHRRLMQRFHPDRGGSDYLAAKINQAKDVLLKK
jgi:hypothetical protein